MVVWKGLFMVQIVPLFEWSATSCDFTIYPYCHVTWLNLLPILSGIQMNSVFRSSVFSKYRRSRVPTRGSSWRRISKLCNLSWVKAESQNWKIEVEYRVLWQLKPHDGVIFLMTSIIIVIVIRSITRWSIITGTCITSSSPSQSWSSGCYYQRIITRYGVIITLFLSMSLMTPPLDLYPLKGWEPLKYTVA